jgi:hypothetical protein
MNLCVSDPPGSDSLSSHRPSISSKMKPTVYFCPSHFRGIIELLAMADFVDLLVDSADGTVKGRTREELQLG